MNSEPTGPVRSPDNVAGLAPVSDRRRNGKSDSRRKKRADRRGKGQGKLPGAENLPVPLQDTGDENEDVHSVDYLA